MGGKLTNNAGCPVVDSRYPELKAILKHNRDEEKGHASTALEWMRRKDTAFSKQLKGCLFTDKSIARG